LDYTGRSENLGQMTEFAAGSWVVRQAREKETINPVAPVNVPDLPQKALPLVRA